MNGVPNVNQPSASPGVQQPFPLMVLAWGLLTSLLTLSVVHWLSSQDSDFHIMGWYADYVIPAGALLVGIAASSGYGLASWFSGIKITKRLLWTVLALQVLVYFVAQYIEFRHLQPAPHNRDGTPMSFFTYYDRVARAFAWKKEHGGGSGEPLGAWGYFFRGLEVLGFAGGSLIVPAVLFKAPYCQACQRYMRTRALGTVGASVPLKKVKKKDVAGLEAHQAEQNEAFAKGNRITEIMQGLAADGKSTEFKQTLGEVKAAHKKAYKLPARFQVHLTSCRKCQAGWLRLNLLRGQGKQVSNVEVSRQDLDPEFVSNLQK